MSKHNRRLARGRLGAYRRVEASFIVVVVAWGLVRRTRRTEFCKKRGKPVIFDCGRGGKKYLVKRIFLSLSFLREKIHKAVRFNNNMPSRALVALAFGVYACEYV